MPTVPEIIWFLIGVVGLTTVLLTLRTIGVALDNAERRQQLAIEARRLRIAQAHRLEQLHRGLHDQDVEILDEPAIPDETAGPLRHAA